MTEDDAQVAFLSEQIPELMNLIETRFAGHPGLVLDFLVQALVVRSLLTGLPKEVVLEQITTRWEALRPFVQEAATLVAKSQPDGKA